ncbi:MAG: peptidoglycan editing factor PgeF [Methylococcales bacterium]|nr:peptidoglycan editing factor PgeF [Methylococcales bacterium]
MPIKTANHCSYISPEWKVPSHVHAIMTLRQDGNSLGQYASLNPATHVGDDIDTVMENRRLIRKNLRLPSEPIWLNQTHSTTVVQADKVSCLPEADASFTEKPNTICSILTADCLPLLLCSQDGGKIAAIHAGWRGLLAGIIGKTVQKMHSTSLSVWLGAAIGQCCFEVGAEVRASFIHKHRHFETAFIQTSPQKYHMDLYQLARIDLALNGINNTIYGGNFCTACDADRFYSYRRDQQTGRMATLIWKD